MAWFFPLNMGALQGLEGSNIFILRCTLSMTWSTVGFDPGIKFSPIRFAFLTSLLVAVLHEFISIPCIQSISFAQFTSVRQDASKTNNWAGDGTTTFVVLALGLIANNSVVTAKAEFSLKAVKPFLWVQRSAVLPEKFYGGYIAGSNRVLRSATKSDQSMQALLIKWIAEDTPAQTWCERKSFYRAYSNNLKSSADLPYTHYSPQTISSVDLTHNQYKPTAADSANTGQSSSLPNFSATNNRAVPLKQTGSTDVGEATLKPSALLNSATPLPDSFSSGTFSQNLPEPLSNTVPPVTAITNITRTHPIAVNSPTLIQTVLAPSKYPQTASITTQHPLQTATNTDRAAVLLNSPVQTSPLIDQDDQTQPARQHQHASLYKQHTHHPTIITQPPHHPTETTMTPLSINLTMLSDSAQPITATPAHVIPTSTQKGNPLLMLTQPPHRLRVDGTIDDYNHPTSPTDTFIATTLSNPP